MMRRADAAGAIRQFSRIGFGIGDELLHRIHRQLRIDDEEERRAGDHSQRHKIRRRIVGQALVHRDVDRHRRRRRHQQRVAVGRRLRDRGRADHGAGARLVLHDDRLAEPLLEFLGDDARQDLGAAAGRVRHDQRDRPRRIFVRSRRRRRGHCRQERDDGRKACSKKCRQALHRVPPIVAGERTG